MSIKEPAPRPCESCPYRKDVPSGVWAEEEYRKLPDYDQETMKQPMGVFLCHQQNQRVCGGWAGVHGRQSGSRVLLSVRMMASIENKWYLAEQIYDYVSPFRCSLPDKKHVITG